jgi:hypothetical protein
MSTRRCAEKDTKGGGREGKRKRASKVSSFNCLSRSETSASSFFSFNRFFFPFPLLSLSLADEEPLSLSRVNALADAIGDTIYLRERENEKALFFERKARARKRKIVFFSEEQEVRRGRERKKLSLLLLSL